MPVDVHNDWEFVPKNIVFTGLVTDWNLRDVLEIKKDRINEYGTRLDDVMSESWSSGFLVA